MKMVGLPATPGQCGTVSLLLHSTWSPSLICGACSNSKMAGPPAFGFLVMLIRHVNGMRNSSWCNPRLPGSPERRRRPALLEGVVARVRCQVAVVFRGTTRVVPDQGVGIAAVVVADHPRGHDPRSQGPHHTLRGQRIDSARRVANGDPPVSGAAIEAL